MKRIDTSTLELDQDTLLYAANDLWQELNGIERYYPQVLDDKTYCELKRTCANYAYGRPTQPQLETFYQDLIQCLRDIATPPSSIVSLVAKREGAKRLSDYLPPTFKAFVDKVTEEKLQAEYYENAYDGAAAALFMREIEGGMDAIVPRHREAVKERIYEILMENAEEEDEKVIDETAMDRILELMGITDEFDLVGEAIGQADQAICELILFIREELDAEYEDVDAAELRLKSPSREEFEALGSGMQKLLLAMVQDKSRYGDAKELGRAHRMEFARRIITPRLKAVEDRRPSVMDARTHGLTSLEIKVLLMSGYLKVPSDDEPLERHGPDMQIEGTEETLEDLERWALTYDAMQPDSGRTDN